MSISTISIAIGIAILVSGRKLFWLFVAALGFAVGLEIAKRFLQNPAVWVTLIISIGLGILGAMLAIKVQKLAVAVAGFVAGARLASILLEAFVVNHSHYSLITFIIGGILGAILLLALFDYMLILLSSVEGAHLITNTLALPQVGAAILFVGLALAGVIIQGSLLTRSRGAAT